MKTFQIEFVRELLNQKLDNENIALYSFFEELTSDEEVNRYVETFKELCEQQNKTSNVGFGIVSVTNSPSFINLNRHTILPFEWGCSIRTTLANRDDVANQIYNMIDKIKGRKFDVAMFDNGKLFPLGTIGNYDMLIHDGDFIGNIIDLSHNGVSFKIASYNSSGFSLGSTTTMVYAEFGNKLYRFEYNSTTSEWENTTERNVTMNVNTSGTAYHSYTSRAIPSHNSFEKWKISISCDSVKVEQPFSLNALEYCNITFGGSATICKNEIRIGNDMVRFRIQKKKVIISDNIAQNYSFASNWFDIEPMEIGSGMGLNSIPNQIRSNYFNTNSHNDSTTTTFQYAFVVDTSISLIKQWFDYARYGITGTSGSSVFNDNCITPNIIYEIKEIWSSWGIIDTKTFLAKISNDLDIENTEGDITLLNVSFQLQGDNY